MDIHTNGTALLIDEIDAELSKRNISQRDKLMLKSMRYLLEEVPITRGNIFKLSADVAILEKNNIVLQAKKHPKIAAMLMVGLLAANSMINWAGIRRPIMQGIIHITTGILVPLDALP